MLILKFVQNLVNLLSLENTFLETSYLSFLWAYIKTLMCKTLSALSTLTYALNKRKNLWEVIGSDVGWGVYIYSLLCVTISILFLFTSRIFYIVFFVKFDVFGRLKILFYQIWDVFLWNKNLVFSQTTRIFNRINTILLKMDR